MSYNYNFNIGIDIVPVNKMEKIILQHDSFLAAIFTKREIAYCLGKKKAKNTFLLDLLLRRPF